MVRPYGHKLKLDKGKPFSFCSFSWTKERAKEKASDIGKKGYNVRIVPERNENGHTVHLVYKRRN